MVDPRSSEREPTPLAVHDLIDRICDRFEEDWKDSTPPRVEDLLSEVEAPWRPRLLTHLISLDLSYRRAAGDVPCPGEYRSRFPGLERAVDDAFLRGQHDPRHPPPHIAVGPAPEDPINPVDIGEGKPFGDYRLLEEIGRGGMGVVHRAWQTSHGRVVALKMIKEEWFYELSPKRRAEVLARFKGEIRLATTLDHPNIVPIFDFGEHRGRYFYAMRWIPGRSLARALRDGPVPGDQAAAFLEPIARAVQYAHDCGVLHRDLKPGNILLDTDGFPYVADFGLAKSLEDSQALTTSMALLGTPSYMSPEQAQDRGEIGWTSDVYSLGATLYDLLTGHPPFRAATPAETIRQVIYEDPVSPRKVNSAIPRDLETICLKCLEKEPHRRFATAAEMADELQRFIDGKPILTRPVGPMGRACRWARRNPGSASMAGSILLIVVVSLSIIYGLGLSLIVAQRDLAVKRVDTLIGAPSGQVPLLLEELKLYREEVRPRLLKLRDSKTLSPQAHARVILALMPDDPTRADRRDLDELRDALLTAEPPELLVLRAALHPHRDRYVRDLWSNVDDVEAPQDRSFRAACALATFDADSARWSRHAPAVAAQLSLENPLYIADWIDVLEPVRGRLAAPLATIVRDRDRVGRSQAAVVLGRYADALAMFRLLGDEQVEPRLVHILAGAFRGDRPTLISLLLDLARKGTTSPKGRCNAGIALISMGRAEAAWPLLASAADPEARSFLLHAMSQAGVPSGMLIRRMEQELDPGEMQALVLALSDYKFDKLSDTEQALMRGLLERLYRTHPSSGVHSAVEYLGRAWSIGEGRWAAGRSLVAPTGKGDAPRWRHGPNGHTMVQIRGPVTFRMGAPAREVIYQWQREHEQTIADAYEIADKEVTNAQYLRFEFAPRFFIDRLGRPPGELAMDRPVVMVSYDDALRYCRLLGEVDGENGRAPADSQGLRRVRRDYRLPTEAEWEFACRAGSDYACHFGRSKELLPYYEWYYANSNDQCGPVGTRKPNPFGLFDMLGNVQEWCQRTLASAEASLPPTNSSLFPVRGATHITRAPLVHSAQRFEYSNQPVFLIGFRVARTCPR